MATQIVIKNSSVAGNVPDPADLHRGELAINLADQRLFSKNTSDEVFEIGADAQVPNGEDPPVDGNQPGDLFYDTSTDSLLYWNGSDWVPIAGSEALALNDLSDVTAGSPTDGQVLSYDLGTTSWIPVSPASLTVDVDLGYTAAADGGTVTNSAGDDAAMPLADGSNAGLMAPADFTKLDGIEAGAQVNPDLGTYLQSGDNVSELTNDVGYVQSGDNVSELTNDAGYLQSGDNVSELTNDAGYITLGDVPAQTTPTLEEVLTAGNTATSSITTTGDISGAAATFTGNVIAAGFRIDQLTTLPTD